MHKTSPFKQIINVGINKNAFTLAEVLITLTIIGIVAAMTIPTLITNIQNKQFEVAATLFERKLDEALRVMNSQNKLGGQKTTERFIKALSKSFKITDICTNDNLDNCFISEFESEIINLNGDESGEKTIIATSQLKTISDIKQSSNQMTNLVGIRISNGSTAIIGYNNKDCKGDPYSNDYDVMKCISIIYDTNGEKEPNILGKDIRNYNTSLNSELKFNDKFWILPKKNVTALSKSECIELLGKENCPSDKDYWAGAVKACGGLDKLPTNADLTALSKHLYSNGYWNETMIQTLFSNVPKANRYDIWTNERANPSTQYTYYETALYTRYFMATSTALQEYTFTRSSTSPLVMCLSD